MMNKFTKLLIAIFVVLALVSSVNLNAATKRVIVEDHTGTWCGWCVRGISDMDDLKKMYPTTVFPVAVHNGDPMALPAQNEIATKFGLQGFPSGLVDRANINSGGSTVNFIDPGEPDGKGGNWGNVAAQILKNACPLDVSAVYTYDSDSRLLSVTVTADIEQNVVGQTAFNAIVVENSVVGDYTNAQWKQHNYYSKNSSYPNSPWYNKNATEDLTYDFVLRGYMGGSFGDIKDIPSTLVSGQKYTKSFSTVLPVGVNPDNIQVIGAVQYQGTLSGKFYNAYINSNLATKGVVNTKVTSTDPNIAATAQSANFNKSWSCQNLSNSAVEFTISVAKSQRTPTDWTVSLDKSLLSVGPGGTQTCKVTITPGATHGVGDALVTISNGLEYNRTFTVTSVSKELERVEINADNQVEKLFDVASGLSKSTDYKGINSLTANEAVILQDITSLKTIIVSTGHSGSLNKATADAIETALKAGKKLFLNGAMSATGIGLNSIPTTLLNTLSVSFNGTNNILTSIVASSFFALSGVTSDPISNAFKVGSLKMIFDASGNGYYLESLNIVPGKSTVPFLTIDGQTFPNVGVRGDVGGTRFVVLNINPYVIPDGSRLPLMVKIMDWLENKQYAPDPSLTMSVDNIAYGDVKIKTTKESSFDIKNSGPGKLIISELSTRFGDNFSIKNAPTLPLNIDAGQTVKITVVFAPSKVGENYSDGILYVSNDPKNQSGAIELTGKGISATSVDGEEGIDGLFTVKAGPNPFVSNTTISYNLGGNATQNVNMTIIDTKGATVANLLNETKAPGIYKLDFSGANLANGTYFLIAKANGIDVRLPLSINK